VKQRLATLATDFAKRPWVLGDEFSALDILMATAPRMVGVPNLLADATNVVSFVAPL